MLTAVYLLQPKDPEARAAQLAEVADRPSMALTVSVLDDDVYLTWVQRAYL